MFKTRAPAFTFSRDIASQWSPDEPEFSHVASAFMAALPHLEPYFIHNVREALSRVSDPVLREQTEDFVAQEARHAQQHRRFNTLLAERYPRLPALERAIRERLDKSRREHSLGFRLAYTAGYEAITYHFACFLFAKRHRWLQRAHPSVLALLVWHAAEEVEHRTVAFDVFDAVHGGYLMRLRGLLSAFFHTVREIRVITRYLLECDGSYHTWACQRRLWGVRFALLVGLGPRFAAYLLPTYQPKHERVPAIAAAWLRSYDAGRPLTELTLEQVDELAVEAG